MKIKKNDQVIIIKGKDSGKQSKVEKILVDKNKAILASLNTYKKHLKPSQKNPHGGIVDMHMPISVANLALICPRCEKITRINYKTIKNQKIRMCSKCKETVDK